MQCCTYNETCTALECTRMIKKRYSTFPMRYSKLGFIPTLLIVFLHRLCDNKFIDRWKGNHVKIPSWASSREDVICVKRVKSVNVVKTKQKKTVNELCVFKRHWQTYNVYKCNLVLLNLHKNKMKMDAINMNMEHGTPCMERKAQVWTGGQG